MSFSRFLSRSGPRPSAPPPGSLEPSRSRSTQLHARVIAASALGVALAHIPLARADDVPLPVPPVDGKVVKTTDTRIGRPLWEFGGGGAVARFPDYRGSDQSSTYAVPFPLVVYRGRFLRADRDGARAVLFSGSRIELDVSVAASVPTRSSHNDARRGMPNLPGSFEIGPNMNVGLWQSKDETFKLDLRLPVREAITLSTSPRAIGVTFSPNVNLDVRRFSGDWNLGLLAGPLYATRRYHEHYYGVAPAFANGTRPSYQAGGGYAGWRATSAFSRRVGNAWLGGFVRYDDLHGAAFAASPLVRSTHNTTVGFGISWVFARSSQLVEADD